MLINLRIQILKILTCSLLLTGTYAYGLKDYISEKTLPIQGFQPYFKSVAPYVYLNELPEIQYRAVDNDNVKIRLKVGDILTIPMNILPENYNTYFFWQDKDGNDNYSDKANMPLIRQSVQWYRVEYGATDIGSDAVLLTLNEALNASVGRSYQISNQDVGFQIGFKITPYSILGIPKIGEQLEVPNVAYLGRQNAPLLPENKVTTSPLDKNNPEHHHPDILDRPITKEDEYQITIKDITDINNPIDVNENTEIFVTHRYQAKIAKYDPIEDAYVDVTETFAPFLAWSLFQETSGGERVGLYQYMTKDGLINNIPTDKVLLSQFDPEVTPFEYESIDKAKISARFVEGNNSVIQLQQTNDDALPKTKITEPNFSEQGLKLKVYLLIR